MFKIIIQLTALFLISTNLVFGEENKSENEIIAFHPMGGLQYNFYNSNFSSFENMVDCGIFDGGTGFGSSAFLFVERPFGQRFHLALGFGINDKSGEMLIQNEFNSRSSNSFTDEIVKTDNILDISLNYFEVVPGVNYLIADDFFTGRLRLFSGFKFSFLNTNTFSQNEKIVSPDNAVFIADNNFTQDRLIAADKISSANSLLYGINLALENMIKVGSKNYFTQRLAFDYFLNDITQDADWKTYAVRFELGYRFSMHKKEKIIPPKPAPAPQAPEPVEPVIVEKLPDPIVEISINEEKSNFKLETGNEILATVPVVNSVFFSTNSSEIPAYYETDDTGVNYFSINPVEAHKYILPRIARILKNNPDAEITLVSSVSIDETEQGIELSKKRADAVKNKLIELGVTQNIKTEARIAPQFPSSKEFEQGRIENQRVTININNAQLQEYVDVQNFAEVVGRISFDTKIENTSENINISSNMAGDNLISNSTGSYSLNARKRLSDESEFPAIITYNSDGFSGSDTTFLTINDLEKEIIELKLDNFEAILRFNYDSSELSYENRLLLKQLVNKLPEGTTIEILGSADELGSAQRNQQLEIERATNTERFIKNNTNKNINIITGTNDKKFDESTPQGRFLNRSIIIRVK